MQDLEDQEIKIIRKDKHMRVLIEIVGSHGDFLPFLAIGKELRRRGHNVRLYANAGFEPYAQDVGLHFTATSSAAYYDQFLKSPNATDPRKGMKLVAEGVMTCVASTYETMKKDVLAGQTIVIGSSFAFAARLLKETHLVPVASVHLAPSLFRSEYLAPRFSPIGHMENVPRFIKRFIWKLMDRKLLDPIYTAPFNRIRAQLGLKPIERLMHNWIHEADLKVGMFPEWFAERQVDWPSKLELTNFPLYDNGSEQSLTDELCAFLDAGEAPIAFTTGTANAMSHAFFSASVEACRMSGRRGILIAQNPEQIPKSLPDGVVHFSYLPFKALLPRLGAFVHHGGIGSTSQALDAGVPQLIRPMAYDQFDNASRAVRLGVAREILPRRYTPANVNKLLEEIIGNAEVEANCKNAAAKLSVANGVSETCDVVVKYLADKLRSKKSISVSRDAY